MGVNTGKKRISTTISKKHWDILKKHTDEFETQQKTLEHALECFEINLKQSPALSREEQLWMRIGREMMPSLCLLPKIIFEELTSTADYERMKELLTRLKLAEYLLVWYYKKPLKKCSLKEIVDGITFTFKMGNIINTIDYMDYDNYYALTITHTIQMKGSKLLKIFFKDLFNLYGARSECEVGENSFFMKVFKNE